MARQYLYLRKNKNMNLEKFRGFTIYSGFSGGADSLALLLFLAELSEKLELKIKAVHFQHNLRGKESAADASWCADFCRKKKVDFREIQLNVKSSMKPGESIESAARRLRIEAWGKLLSGKEKTVVALGHHADDRVENFFLRLCRGSNLSGLTSMRHVQKIGNITFIRPLLAMNKKNIIEFLRSRGIKKWREDSTNSDTVYKRNFFRKKILPPIYSEIDFAEDGIAQSVSVLEQDSAFIEAEAEKKFRLIKEKKETDSVFWSKLHSALRIRVLRSWLSELFGEDFIPDKNLIGRFNQELSRPGKSGEKIIIPVKAGISIKLQKGKCSILKTKIETPEKKILWNWKKTKSIKWGSKILSICLVTKKNSVLKKRDDTVACFDAEVIPENLILRVSEDGDRMIPFGSEKSIRLKKIFSDRKISSDDKSSYPLLCLPDESIIWIPGIRRSNFAPVSEKTKSVLMFSSTLKN